MHTKTGQKGHLIFLSLVLLLIFCWIEVDLYAPAFPQLRHHFNTTEAMIQWTLSINFIGYFISSLLVGPLADSYGRRPVLLAGCGAFITGSLLCLAAPNLGLLLAGRFLQGLGVSAPTILAVTVIGDLFADASQVKLFSLMNSMVTITMAAAPIAGAFLSQSYGWRANFALILGGSVLGAGLVYALVPESHPVSARPPFSLGRMARTYGTLLGDRFFMTTTLGLVFLGLPYFIFIATIPFLFLETLRLPMARYVYFQGAVVGLFAVLSLLVPVLVGRVNSRRMLLASISITLLGGICMYLHSLFLPDAALGITLLICVFVAGIVWPGACLYAAIFAAFPDLRGSASALFSAMRMLIMATAIFISGNLYQDTFRSVAGWMLVLIGCGFLLILGSRARPGAEITPDGLGPH